ncbi:MAG TPA: FtsX-like permease family protein [Longimicrobiales bacterium]|nr:FtsX-like permease family protein [Longimicrobiales bacterium]
MGLKEETVGPVRAMLWILLGTAGVVLLVAVASVANLFLVRAEDAQRETAVRAALGAGRSRLVGSWLAESLLLSALGAVVGIAGAAAGVGLLQRYAPTEVPRLDEVGLHTPALLVALGLTVSAALLLGLVPALRQRGAQHAMLKEGGRATGGPSRLRARNALAAAQIALALVLP